MKPFDEILPRFAGGRVDPENPILIVRFEVSRRLGGNRRLPNSRLADDRNQKPFGKQLDDILDLCLPANERIRRLRYSRLFRSGQLTSRLTKGIEPLWRPTIDRDDAKIE